MEKENTNENLNTRKLIYKGKTKEIPEKNADEKLCEFYIVARMRYCKFEKHVGTQFCIYHLPNDTVPDVSFVNCPIDPSHRVLASKLKRHVKVCNKLGEKERLQANVWYKSQINKVPQNESLIKSSTDKTETELNSLKWEDLSEEEYSLTLDKIQHCYELLKEDYKNYIESNNLNQILNEVNLANCSIDKDSFNLTFSALSIDPDNDYNFTKDLPKSEKNGKQNKAITDVIKSFNLLDRNTYIEFGAGKGGLSHYINTLTNDKSIHILLERDGVRYKKDKYSDKLIRFRTDILDFEANYIDQYIQENKILEKGDYTGNMIGVAKHICGCAFDLSLTCLNNYTDQSKIKAICMATCCHHICTLRNLNNLEFYLKYLKMTPAETLLLFRSSSWIFGPIDQNKTEDFSSSQIFVKKGKKKNFYGLISKYVIDLARVFYLISTNHKVFYLKYCTNDITTENNLILALKQDL